MQAEKEWTEIIYIDKLNISGELGNKMQNKFSG